MLRALADVDLAVLRFMRTRLHGPRTEAAAKALATSGEWAVVWMLVAATAASLDAPRRSRWLRAGAAAHAAIWLNYGVKLAVRRQRPTLKRLPPLAGAPSKLSFPSAHATSSLAAATAMSRIAPGARVPLYTLAVTLCITRPYLGMHYPSDVLAGAAMGIAMGRLVPGLDDPAPAPAA